MPGSHPLQSRQEDGSTVDRTPASDWTLADTNMPHYRHTTRAAPAIPDPYLDEIPISEDSPEQPVPRSQRTSTRRKDSSGLSYYYEPDDNFGEAQ